MRHALLVLALTLACAAPALAMPWEEHDKWDSNGDGDITEEEWDQSPAGSAAFDDWDIDGDGVIDENEYSTGLFGVYDANDDNDITEEEWDSSFNLDFADDNLYGAWDVNDDAVLGEDEFRSGLFEYYDADDDGVLDDHEWEEEGLLDI